MTEDPTPYGASPFDRLRAAFNTLTKKELAKKLNTSVQKLSFVETTGAIPAEWLLTLLNKEGINPEWIITGKGAKRLMPSLNNNLSEDHRDAFFQIRVRPPSECSTEELLKELFRRAMTNFSPY